MVIINPVSGTRSKRGLDSLIEDRLARAGFATDLRFTTCRGDATRLALEAVEAGYYGVIAVGGDGTVNETARALCDSRLAMGIIPTGSGNGLARHLSIPMDIKGALRVISRDFIKACDYATANGRPFFCTCGFGFDAAVSHRFARQHRRGLTTYLKSAVEEFVHFKESAYNIAIDGKVPFEKDAFLVAVANASQYGNNAFIAPMASITDGKLDLVVVHKGNPLTKMLVGVELMTGTISNNAMVDVVKVEQVVIERPAAGEAHIDGEPIELPARIDIRVHPAELLMFVNKRKPRFRPLLTALAKPFEELGSRIRSLFN